MIKKTMVPTINKTGIRAINLRSIYFPKIAPYVVIWNNSSAKRNRTVMKQFQNVPKANIAGQVYFFHLTCFDFQLIFPHVPEKDFIHVFKSMNIF